MSTQTELALAVHRKVLDLPASDGVYTVNLKNIDPYAYALLPRHIANNKTIESIGLGAAYPQLAGYARIKTSKGKYLSYARKGKEENLHGLRSIGVGGHITQADLAVLVNSYDDPEQLPTLTELIEVGITRELAEEVGIAVESPVEITEVVISKANVSSAVHVGLLSDFVVKGHTQLVYDEAELLDVQWLSVKELKENISAYEPWSQLLINRM